MEEGNGLTRPFQSHADDDEDDKLATRMNGVHLDEHEDSEHEGEGFQSVLVQQHSAAEVLSEVSLGTGDEAVTNGAPAEEPMVSPVSRKELLDIVRKHSDALPRPGTQQSPEQLYGGFMDDRYWREMLDLFFIRGWGALTASSEKQKSDALFDDMLFFVRLVHQDKNGLVRSPSSSGSEIGKPYFVRRWSRDLNAVVGETAADVDWRQSYYLNLICHTAYTLTVAVCSRQALEFHRKTNGPPVTPIRKVTKQVYASPSRARIDMDASKAFETVPSYPDICFAIDDFENAFEAVVLSDADHCFCVLLNAHGGAAFPAEEFFSAGPGKERRLPRRTSSEARALGETTEGTPKVTLFSGFVSYGMVRSAYQGGGNRFGLWGTIPPSAERLVMRGPGGKGEADVAVTSIPEVEEQPKPPTPPKPPLSPGRGSPRASRGGSGSPFRLQELQAKLWSVQEELMKLVQAQQQLGGGGQAPPPEPEQQAREQQEQQSKLLHLQLELTRVQEELQQLQQKDANSPPAPAGASPSKGSGAASPSANAGAGPPPAAPQGVLGSLVRRAAVAASKQVAGYGAAAQKLTPLRCCLMSLSLPWDSLAYDLLFKEMPVKVDITGHILPRLPNREPSQL